MCGVLYTLYISEDGSTVDLSQDGNDRAHPCPEHFLGNVLQMVVTQFCTTLKSLHKYQFNSNPILEPQVAAMVGLCASINFHTMSEIHC